MHATVNIPASEVHGLQLRPPRSIEVTKLPLFPGKFPQASLYVPL